jgi:hypothetical protein
MKERRGPFLPSSLPAFPRRFLLSEKGEDKRRWIDAGRQERRNGKVWPMNKAEALEILRQHLSSWRGRSYEEISGCIGEAHTFEASGPSGSRYQGEIQAFWDGPPNSDIRVIGSIDDGGWRAFLPLSDSFILARDGSFVTSDSRT